MWDGGGGETRAKTRLYRDDAAKTRRCEDVGDVCGCDERVDVEKSECEGRLMVKWFDDV